MTPDNSIQISFNIGADEEVLKQHINSMVVLLHEICQTYHEQPKEAVVMLEALKLNADSMIGLVKYNCEGETIIG